MLKYRCLVLDHDDTVVQTDKTLGYPFFCEILKEFRPGEEISLQDYVRDCHNYGFSEMCKRRWQFTEEDQKNEYRRWMDYIKIHIPAPYPGIGDVIRRQKENGGLVCVASHSSIENITRDYDTHFGIQPDAIYGYDLPKEQRKPSSWALQDMMRRYGLQAKDILVVDDMKLGWMMAKPLGVQIAFAAWSKVDFTELESEMRSICNYTFDSPNALEVFLFEE